MQVSTRKSAMCFVAATRNKKAPDGHQGLSVYWWRWRELWKTRLNALNWQVFAVKFGAKIDTSIDTSTG